MIKYLLLAGLSLLYAGEPPVTINIPDQVYKAGTYTFTSASLANETTFRISINRSFITDPAICIRIIMNISNDNGKTYCPPGIRCYGSRVCGGGAATALVFRNTSAGTRRVQFVVTITGGDPRLSGTFVAF